MCARGSSRSDLLNALDLTDRRSEFQGKQVVPDLGPSQGKNPFATLPKGAPSLHTP